MIASNNSGDDNPSPYRPAPAHAVMAATIQGQLPAQVCRAIINSLQQRYPLLSAAIDDRSTPLTFRQMEGVRIPLHVINGYRHSDLEQAIATELTIPFDWRQAPLLRVVLLQNETDFTLLFVFHAAIANGINGIGIFHDCLRLIGGLPLQPLSPGINEPLQLPAPPSQYTGSSPEVVITYLPASLTTRLHARAAGSDIPVHDLLGAALLAALQVLYPGSGGTLKFAHTPDWPFETVYAGFELTAMMAPLQSPLTMTEYNISSLRVGDTFCLAAAGHTTPLPLLQKAIAILDAHC